MNKLSKQIAYEIEQAKAMKKLFKQVIYRAVMDAIYLRKSQHTNSIEQDRAVAWLKGESNRKDLDTICELAGVSSDRIVRVSKELFKDGGFSLKYRLDYKELFYDERKRKGTVRRKNSNCNDRRKDVGDVCKDTCERTDKGVKAA